MAVTKGFDVDGILDIAREYAPKIITQELNDTDFVKTIGEANFHTDIVDERAFAKVSAVMDAEPYTGTISSDLDGNGLTLSQRTLKVWPGQTVWKADPEMLRRTYISAGNQALIDAGELPEEAFFLQEMMRKLKANLNDFGFYKASRTMSTPTLKLQTIFDGLEKQLLACITDGSIVPYTTSAWSEGSGSGNSATVGNVVDQLQAMDDAKFTVAQRSLNRRYFVSDSVFKKYKRDYQRHFPNLNESLALIDTEEIYLPDTYKKAKVVRCTWLGTSNRVIAAVDGSIKAGISVENFNLTRIEWEDFIMKFLFKMVFGVQIIDPEAVKCNTLT